MKIAIVSGSSRPNNQTHKIAVWVEKKLQAWGVETSFIDLHQQLLPTEVNLLNFKGEPKAQKAWGPIAQMLQSAEGMVVISPEWNGMAPPALMNFFEYASVAGKPLAHKPAQLITLSSTDGGSYPAAQLRVYGPKNNHFFYTPELVIIRNCEKVFNSPEPEAGNSADEYLQKRALHSLKIFMEYVQAMNSLRANATVDLLAYPNGQ